MTTKEKKFEYKGMMAPTFTPFNPDGSLNLAIIPRYAQLLHDGGVTGVFVNGTNGEGMSLTTAERKLVAEAWAKSRGMAGKVVIQVGGLNLRDSQELARHAVSIGASAIACLPHLYDKPGTIAELVAYCKEVASAAPEIPFLYYHIPFKTGVELPMDKFLEAASLEIPNLAGLKFTSMEVETEGYGCLKAVGGSMTVLNGFDEVMSKSRRVGFHGAIGGCLNFMPLEAGRLLCLSGIADDDGSTCCVPRLERLDEIYRLQNRINTLWDIVRKHCGCSFVSGAKFVMKSLTGVDVGPARKPQQPLSEETEKLLSDERRENNYPY
uniref:N-acetylneuraminate lyase n=1 Tax=Hirondellea gigas TaxID=1518452 RepID=A0A2P2I2I4_9CRUS